MNMRHARASGAYIPLSPAVVRDQALARANVARVVPYTLAIDPGSAGEGNACALFRNDTLERVWFEHPHAAPRASTLVIHQVVIERPQQDGRSKKARAKNTIAFTWSGAMLAGLYAGRDSCPVAEYEPRAWKGSQPKPPMHLRLFEGVLSYDERAVLGGERTYLVIDEACERGARERWKPGKSYYPRSFTTHNLLDAVALGCFHLGRICK